MVEDRSVKFTAPGFSVYVVATREIEKVITASDGNTYRITVEYGEAAGIPDNADLRIEELAEDEYPDFVDQTADALALDAEDLAYVKLFDIAIIDEDGEEIEPADEVTVTVELLDMDDAEVDDFNVVHFTEPAAEAEGGEEPAGEEPEAISAKPIDASASQPALEATILDSELDGTTVSFVTDSFSVYSFAETKLTEQQIDGTMKSNGNGNSGSVLYSNDDICLTGKMPKNGIVEVTPETVEIDGAGVLCAYDIKIYANAQQQK